MTTTESYEVRVAMNLGDLILKNSKTFSSRIEAEKMVDKIRKLAKEIKETTFNLSWSLCKVLHETEHSSD